MINFVVLSICYKIFVSDLWCLYPGVFIPWHVSTEFKSGFGGGAGEYRTAFSLDCDINFARLQDNDGTLTSIEEPIRKFTITKKDLYLKGHWAM